MKAGVVTIRSVRSVINVEIIFSLMIVRRSPDLTGGI